MPDGRRSANAPGDAAPWYRRYGWVLTALALPQEPAGSNRAESRTTRNAPRLVVAATVAWCLYHLRGELRAASYLNDSSVHVQMVRFAVLRMRAGHLPLTSWYPFLGEGSPRFLHYQSLGATLTGVLGLLTGANRAFAIVLYVVLATWPLSVYLGTRRFGFGRWTAAAGALCAPLIMSLIGIGYEQQTYLSLGYGLWTQLLAMWTLPLAWGFSYRAVVKRGPVLPAAVLVTLTTALHFLTGYLAIAGVLVFFLVRPSTWRQRLGRAAAVVLGVALTSAWIIVPLIGLRSYSSVNEFLVNTSTSNSYGAKLVLTWLVQGQLFDFGRPPILTLLAAVGVVASVLAARRDDRARAVLGLLAISLALFFGPTTFGALFNAIPGSRDLFYRRFLMGVQLSGIVFVGIGVVAVWRLLATILRRASRLTPRLGTRGRWRSPSKAAAVGLLTLLALEPAWTQISSIDSTDSVDLAYQQQGDVNEGAQIAPLIATIRRLGGGRVYAGLPVATGALGGWGMSFDVGAVPVLKYLAAEDIDEVGYTARTSSLMSNPEAYFDEDDPSDYPLFAVRFLLLPATMRPPVPARRIGQSGAYALWTVNPGGYIQVVDTEGTITDDRTDTGSSTERFVHSDLPAQLRYPTVAFAGRPAAPPTLAAGEHPTAPPGRALSERIDLVVGTAGATVTLNRPAIVLLKSSYDPGWTATVDSRRVPTEMVAPAYVGVLVGRGRHTVTFTYESFGPEIWLLALAAATIVVGLVVAVIGRRRSPGSLAP